MVLDSEIKTKQFANPLVLWNGGQPLIQHIFEGVVVGADDEHVPPQIGAPMPHCLNEIDELALICGHLDVPGRERSTEEGEWPRALVKYHTEARPGCIAIHHELFAEVGEM